MPSMSMPAMGGLGDKLGGLKAPFGSKTTDDAVVEGDSAPEEASAATGDDEKPKEDLVGRLFGCCGARGKRPFWKRGDAPEDAPVDGAAGGSGQSGERIRSGPKFDQMVSAMFEKFDRDKNGYLNAEELNSFNLHIGFDEFSAADFANLCTSLADDASPEQGINVSMLARLYAEDDDYDLEEDYGKCFLGGAASIVSELPAASKLDLEAVQLETSGGAEGAVEGEEANSASAAKKTFTERLAYSPISLNEPILVAISGAVVSGGGGVVLYLNGYDAGAALLVTFPFVFFLSAFFITKDAGWGILAVLKGVNPVLGVLLSIVCLAGFLIGDLAWDGIVGSLMWLLSSVWLSRVYFKSLGVTWSKCWEDCRGGCCMANTRRCCGACGGCLGSVAKCVSCSCCRRQAAPQEPPSEEATPAPGCCARWASRLCGCFKCFGSCTGKTCKCGFQTLWFILQVLKWIVLVLIILVVLVLQFASAYHNLMIVVGDNGHAMPGRLVTVSPWASCDNTSQKIHVYCSGPTNGDGRPTVVLDSMELLGQALAWEPVQRLLSGEDGLVQPGTRVCSLDRPGFGWSPASTVQRRPRTAACEVFGALKAANETPPFVLVGHGYGSMYDRVMADQAQLHGSQIMAGMVMVDGGLNFKNGREFSYYVPSLAFKFCRHWLQPIGLIHLALGGVVQSFSKGWSLTHFPNIDTFLWNFLKPSYCRSALNEEAAMYDTPTNLNVVSEADAALGRWMSLATPPCRAGGNGTRCRARGLGLPVVGVVRNYLLGGLINSDESALGGPGPSVLNALVSDEAQRTQTYLQWQKEMVGKMTNQTTLSAYANEVHGLSCYPSGAENGSRTGCMYVPPGSTHFSPITHRESIKNAVVVIHDYLGYETITTLPVALTVSSTQFSASFLKEQFVLLLKGINGRDFPASGVDVVSLTNSSAVNVGSSGESVVRFNLHAAGEAGELLGEEGALYLRLKSLRLGNNQSYTASMLNTFRYSMKVVKMQLGVSSVQSVIGSCCPEYQLSFTNESWVNSNFGSGSYSNLTFFEPARFRTAIAERVLGSSSSPDKVVITGVRLGSLIVTYRITADSTSERTSLGTSTASACSSLNAGGSSSCTSDCAESEDPCLATSAVPAETTAVPVATPSPTSNYTSTPAPELTSST